MNLNMSVPQTKSSWGGRRIFAGRKTNPDSIRSRQGMKSRYETHVRTFVEKNGCEALNLLLTRGFISLRFAYDISRHVKIEHQEEYLIAALHSASEGKEYSRRVRP